MFRVLSALLIALGCHLLLLLLPLPQATIIPPEITGKSGIEIHLQTTLQDSLPDPIQQEILPQELPKPPTPAVPLEISEQTPEIVVNKTVPPILIRNKTHKKRFPVKAAPAALLRKSANKPTSTPHPKVSTPAIVQAAPIIHKNKKPEYPKLARRRNWQGTVILSVIVSVEGKGKSIRIKTSSGHTLLDKSALQTVSLWHFRHGTKDNIPIEMEVLIPVHFRLK